MKLSIASTLLSATALSTTVSAAPIVTLLSGFNLGANKPTGECKTTADWTSDFNAIKSWSPSFNTIKLFSTSDCDTLANAVPAAKATNMKLWVGVWAVDKNKFNKEKLALEVALQAHGSDWLVGINVGSESLYRKEIDPNVLAEQIYDVKGMVQLAYHAPQVPVGSADTWNVWADGANNPVVKACDVIVVNAFPYWQSARIDDAPAVFREAVKNTRQATEGKPLVVGETGWPTAGPDFGASVPGVDNLQKYWKAIGCELRSQGVSYFWFSGFDEPNKQSPIEKNFGVANSDKSLKIDLTC